MTLTLSSIYQKGGVTCGRKLEEAFKGLVKLMQPDKVNSIVQRFKMCKSFDYSNPLNQQAFFNGLGNYFASLVQSYR